MRIASTLVCICVALAACDRPGRSVDELVPKPQKRKMERPVELRFPLVPLAPGEQVLSATARTQCNTSIEWIGLPDGWLVERQRTDGWGGGHGGSFNEVSLDEVRRAGGEAVPLDVDGLLPRLRLADASGECGKWELAVEVGTSEMAVHDPRSHEFFMDHDSPTAWCNAPQQAVE